MPGNSVLRTSNAIGDGVDALITQTFVNRGRRTPLILATLGLPWQEVRHIYHELYTERVARKEAANV